MVLHENGTEKNEIQEEGGLETDPTTINAGKKLRDFIPIYIPAIEKGLLDQGKHERRFLDFLRAHPSRDWFLRSGFAGRISPFSFLRRNPSPREAPGDSDDDQRQHLGRRFRVPFVRKVNWAALWRTFKEWIREPSNIAFFIWLLFVVGGLILLALVMLGLLDEAIPSSSRRKRWIEVINQILNAFFMIMCLYQHPKLFHHLVLLCRWTEEDKAEMRRVYCKDAAQRPHERVHMAIVVFLLHITCISQYVLCGLYWGFSTKIRPDWAVNVCIGIGIAAPILAGVYAVKSPLGKRYEITSDDESLEQVEAADTLQGDTELKQYKRRVVVTSPEWIGGLFDCWDDATVAFLSSLCTFCVFGWNLERLGFGNMYVHIFTFILLCVAPFLVFSASALSIDDDTIRYVVGIIGVLLCFFGLLYGGFWRIQIRKRFKLPGNPFCCGYPPITDCAQWFFCWCCSLAQEVRTGNFYDIEEDSFYRIVTKEEDARQVVFSLPREFSMNSGIELSFRSLSCPAGLGSRNGVDGLHVSFERAATFGRDNAMRAPAVPVIQFEDK